MKTSSDFIYGLTGQLWPIHFKPLPHELLSSWLTRLSHGHGLKLHTFCTLVFGRERNIWNRDIDKLAPEWLINKLSVSTGTAKERVWDTTLKSYESILYEAHQSNGNTRWITSLGIYHRKHKLFGLQFCPMCLATDKIPYFRKYWRLAFYTECKKHHILLHDCCPECGNPVNFHRAEMGDRSLIKPKSIIHCYQCGFDLRHAAKSRKEFRDIQTNISFRTLLDFHDIGWGYINHSTIPYSHQLFDVYRQICILLMSKGKTGALLKYIAIKIDANWDENFKKRLRGIRFENLRVRDRNLIFNCAIWLLLDWPLRFVEVNKVLKLSSAYLLKDFANSPYWFDSTIKQLLHSGHYSPNAEEIKNAKLYILKNEKRAGITKISKVMGYTTLKR